MTNLQYTELPKEDENKPFIDFKGLKIYTTFLVLIASVFVYLQLNGISIIRDSNTEHEGNQHTTGHHK